MSVYAFDILPYCLSGGGGIRMWPALLSPTKTKVKQTKIK